MPGARRELDDGEPTRLDRVAKHGPTRSPRARPARSGVPARSRPPRSARRAAPIRRRTSIEIRTRDGITLPAPGSTSSSPTVATASSMPRAASRMPGSRAAAATSASSRLSIGVVPACPAVRRRRAPRGRTRRSTVTIPSGASLSASRGPCSTWSSRNAFGSTPPARRAPGCRCSRLPLPGRRRRACADTLDRLDRGDDAERAVEATAARNRVEVRARPARHSTVRSARRGCRGGRHLHLEPGLGEPGSRQPCAASWAGEGCGRFAPGPPPIA